jgi:tetratricopeptide (TPR) repeat protein
MTGNFWQSAFAAALFALHPLRVESVAWASERKDVLSMLFGLASLYAYVLYAESNKLSGYFLCLILFALGLMAKPMLVTLPFVLLLLDYWPLGRWQKNSAPVNVPVPVVKKVGGKKNKQHKADSAKENSKSAPSANRSPLFGSLLLEKAPFIFLTIVSSIVTFWAQNKGEAVIPMEHISFPERVGNTIVSYVSYLGKMFWPVDLAVFYPYEHSLPLWQILIFCFILIIITGAVIYTVKKLPFLFTGWFWYLGTLVPVIGLVQVGEQSMADRYTYLPSIGIAIMLAWGIPLFFRSADMRKKILFPAGVAVLIILTALTWRQCGYWKNTIELFNHDLQVTKNNDYAHANLGSTLLEEGQNEAAIEHYNETIRIKPDDAHYRFNRGLAWFRLGQWQRAVEDYSGAIALKPDFAEAYNNRGAAYDKLDQYQRAIDDLNKAVNLKQDYGMAYVGLAIAHLNRGNKEPGCTNAQKACEWGYCRILETAKSRGDCR